MSNCKSCQSLLNEVKGLTLKFKSLEDVIKSLKISVDSLREESTSSMSPAGRVLRSKKISKPTPIVVATKTQTSSSTTSTSGIPSTPTNTQSISTSTNPAPKSTSIPVSSLATPLSNSTQAVRNTNENTSMDFVDTVVQKSILGTGVNISNLRAAPPVTQKTFLYLSNFVPDTTCDQVKDYVSNQFGYQLQHCVKLVREAVDVNTLHFISFKISIPSDQLELFLNPSAWPARIIVREFISKNGQRVSLAQTST